MKTGSVLITGGYGFIGRNIAKYYGEKGWNVTAIGHGAWSRKEWTSWNIAEWHTSDITLDALVTYAGQPNVIVHCAGGASVGFSLTHPFQDYQRTVETAAHVLEFVRLHAPDAVIVYPSSAGVYGIASKQPIPADSPLNPVSPYGVHKKMAEDLLGSYGRHFGVSSAIVRLFSVYGEGLRKQLLWDCCNKIKHGEYRFYGTGNETRDLLHIADTAALLYHVSGHASSACPIYNGGAGTGVRIQDIVEEMFKCYSSPSLPHFTGKIRQGDPQHYQADISQALSLGWKPTITWQTGIRHYVDWFKNGES